MATTPKGKKNKDETRTNVFERQQNKTIEYSFTEDELKAKSRELAHAVHDKEQIENQKKMVMSEFKNKLDTINGDISRLSNHISNGNHMLTVKCRVLFRPDDCLKEIWYAGKLYTTEKMTDLDYQTKLEIREETEEEEVSKDLF